MIVYLTIYSLLALTALATFHKSPSSVMVRSVLFFLTLFAGTRYRVGCDFTSYIEKSDYIVSQFDKLPFNEFVAMGELGFALLALLRSALELDILWMNLIITIIFFIGVDMFLRRFPNPFSIIAIMFPILIVGLVMSGLRQAAATGFLLMALSYYIDQKRYRFLIALLVGFTFHASVIMFLPLFFTIGKRFDIWRILAAIAVGTPFVLMFMDSRLDTYQERYLDSDLEAAGAIYRSILIALPAFALMLLPGKMKNWSNTYDNFLRISSCTLSFLVPITLYSSVIGERLGQYFVPLSAVVAVFLAHSMPRSRSGVPYVLVAILFAYFFYQVFWFSYSYHADFCYLPYRTYLFML